MLLGGKTVAPVPPAILLTPVPVNTFAVSGGVVGLNPAAIGQTNAQKGTGSADIVLIGSRAAAPDEMIRTLIPNPPGLAAIRRCFVENYRRAEGDVSNYMLAGHAFSQIPKRYRPGKTIELVGVKIPRDKFLETNTYLVAGNLPPDTAAVTDADGNYIFWFHPMACEKPVERPGESLREREKKKAVFEHTTKLLREYARVRGKGVVSSSVRTVLLYEVEDRPLESPFGLKLHLPVSINGIGRDMTVGEIEKARRKRAGFLNVPPVYYAAAFGGHYVVQSEFSEVGSSAPVHRNYELGFLIRDAGFKIDGGKIHFQIPFFALFGHGDGKLLSLVARLYAAFKKKNPSLTQHEFIVDYLIAPYVSPILERMNQDGIYEHGFHCQNAVLKFSAPVDAVTSADPFSWVESPDLVLEEIATKEDSGEELGIGVKPTYQNLETFVSNLWHYFSSDLYWAASFPGFDRQAFRARATALLRQYRPSETPPAGVDTNVWKSYRAHFENIERGLESPVSGLRNEVFPLPYKVSSYGMAFSFVHGSILFTSALSGMEHDTEAAFTIMYDKIAFLTVAYPDADISELVEHENRLHRTAKQKAARDKIIPQNNPVSFLNYVLAEAYAFPEIARLREATLNHSGLAGFGEKDREWLANFIFDPESGVFQRQLAAYKTLRKENQQEISHENLPRVGYWFRMVVLKIFEAMNNSKKADIDTQNIGAQLAVSKDFIRMTAKLKSYDRGPFFKWLAARVFGID